MGKDYELSTTKQRIEWIFQKDPESACEALQELGYRRNGLSHLEVFKKELAANQGRVGVETFQRQIVELCALCNQFGYPSMAGPLAKDWFQNGWSFETAMDLAKREIAIMRGSAL